MRINFASVGMRGGRLEGVQSSMVSLIKKNGEMNWAKLIREVQDAIDRVQEDKGTPGKVERLEIQIQRGPE